ncbi:hypothetical protein AKO1_012739, partial [Acrasis kona]
MGMSFCDDTLYMTGGFLTSSTLQINGISIDKPTIQPRNTSSYLYSYRPGSDVLFIDLETDYLVQGIMTCNINAQQLVMAAFSSTKRAQISILTVQYTSGQVESTKTYGGLNSRAFVESSTNYFTFCGQITRDVWGFAHNNDTRNNFVCALFNNTNRPDIPSTLYHLPNIDGDVIQGRRDEDGLMLILYKRTIDGAYVVLAQETSSAGVLISYYMIFKWLSDLNCRDLISVNSLVYITCDNGVMPVLASFDRCSQCPMGTWSSYGSQSACNNCPMGTWSNGTGLTSADQCFKCPLGTFNANNASVSVFDCVSCPVGTFNDVPGAVSLSDCVGCPPGYHSNITGAVDHEQCEM